MTKAFAELRPEQIQRVIAFVTDAWVDLNDDEVATERALSELLDAIESPLELHFCATGFNWDTSVHELRRIADHPLCDRGTALCVFWLGQPEWYYGRARAELGKDARDTRDLLEAIEARYGGHGYASEQIRFDPTRFGPENLTRYAREQQVWDRPIPAVMFEPSPGVEVMPPPELRERIRP